MRPIEAVSTSNAAFIGIADKGPVPGTTLPTGKLAVPVAVTSFTEYVRIFGGFRKDSFLTYAAKAFFDNGGRRLYIVRVLGTNKQGFATSKDPLPVSALTQGEWGNRLSYVVTPSSDGAADNFRLTVKLDGADVETYDPVTHSKSKTFTGPMSPTPAEYVRTAVNSRSGFIAIIGDVEKRPDDSKIPSPPAPSVRNPTYLVDGSDGPIPTDAEFIGTPAIDDSLAGTGLYALDEVADVNTIAIPGQGAPRTVNAGLSYCKTARTHQDCFFIGDMGVLSATAARAKGAAPDVQAVADAVSYATGSFGGTPVNKTDGDYGALYYPWLWSVDPIGTGRKPRILLPPSGFVAGIYARTDHTRGVFKAPAGSEAGVVGALAVASAVSDGDQDQLNPIGVNVMRALPGSGIVVWGARTVASDAEGRHIAVRRTAIFLRASIRNGIQWAVFEPNDEPLWASLRSAIGSFLLTQFQAGAFQGSKPDDAFFVKCDSDTTTQADINDGIVNILVGFAPLKPAEFVVLRIQQRVNQPGM